MLTDVAVISMDQFSLGWRFTDPKYCVLSAAELEKIKPLDARSARRILDVASEWSPMPPSPSAGFSHVVRKAIEGYGAEEVTRVQEWLFLRGGPFDQEVVASWSNQEAALTTWEILARYWNAFWYPSSDDLLVFDASLAWALFISHEEQVFFGHAITSPLPLGERPTRSVG